MNKSTFSSALHEQVFFEDPAIDRLLGVLMTLATDHYVLRDRIRVLEEQLSRAGRIDPALLAQAPDEAQRDVDDADAAEFVDSLLRPLLGVQEAAGTPGFFTLKNS